RSSPFHLLLIHILCSRRLFNFFHQGKKLAERRSLQKRSIWSNCKEGGELALQKGNTIQNP
ncbi:hypothetical protein, partial [Ornithobacterium rhinotracheale]